jgi:hypothetical protein
MTAEAKFSEVVDAVRLLALDEGDQPVEFDHTLIGRVERALGLDISNGDWIGRQARSKFVGQVGRALDKLAAERVLVKSGQGRGNVRYWAPAAWEIHQAREAHATAEEQVLIERGARLRARLKALDLPGGWSDYGHTGVVMDLDVLAALLDLAERPGS